MGGEQKYKISTQHVINNKLVDSKSSERHSLYNPSDDSLFTDQVQYAGEAEVDAAVDAAEAAFRGPWRKFSTAQRAAALHKLADLLEANKDEIAWLDGIPTGKTKMFVDGEFGTAAAAFRYYAGWADKYHGETFPADDGFLKIVRHEPLGVTVGINPWNGPIGTMCMKLAPALATGNVMISKPSEKSPLGCLRFAQLVAESGILPTGVFQAIAGDGKTGALLAHHMKVRKVSFTGSVNTGRRIQQAAAASNLKRVTLELGGKSPAAIFDDCNFDNAVMWTVNAMTANSGQVCIAASRIYVQETIADKFIEAYTAAFKKKLENIEGEVGPLADKQQFDRVASFFEKDQGNTKILAGGKRHGAKGCFWEPSIFYNPDPNAAVYKEEIFGPVSCIRTFKDEADFLKMANDSEFGLMAGVFTQDINRAMRISAELDSGVVGVNCVSYLNLQVPFGGTKSSGQGRELGHYAMRSFTEPKSILINMTY